MADGPETAIYKAARAIYMAATAMYKARNARFHGNDGGDCDAFCDSL